MSRHSRVLSVAWLALIVVVLSPTQASVQARWPISLREPSAKLPTEAPTISPHSTLTATSTPTLRPSATISITKVRPSSTPTATSTITSVAESVAATPVVPLSAVALEGIDPPANVTDPALPIITQASNVGGFVLGLTVLGGIIWLGLSRLSRAITSELRTMSLATLRLWHEAERIDRREKVVFRADSDVLSLLEQAILDATGENVRVHLLPHGWLASPPLMAVVDADQTRYIFSPTPPDQVQAIARRQGLAQLLLGRATDLTAYPIDALNSTPCIADDLSGAYGYVLARHQAPRRPLPRTDRWYLYLARPRASRWPSWLNRSIRQPESLKRFTDRLHGVPNPTTSATDRTSKTGD